MDVGARHVQLACIIGTWTGDWCAQVMRMLFLSHLKHISNENERTERSASHISDRG